MDKKEANLKQKRIHGVKIQHVHGRIIHKSEKKKITQMFNYEIPVIDTMSIRH